MEVDVEMKVEVLKQRFDYGGLTNHKTYAIRSEAKQKMVLNLTEHNALISVRSRAATKSA